MSGNWLGVQTCGLAHECPACMGQIASERRRELTRVLELAVADGYHPYLVTLTIRHRAGQTSGELVRGIMAAWARCHSGRAWQDLRDDLQPEIVRAIEVTYGDHGPHPHYHAIVLVPSLYADRTDVGDRLVRYYDARWGDAVAGALGEDCRPSDAHGADVTWEEDAHARSLGDYATKLGLELTLGGSKEAGGLTPLAILERWVESRDEADWRAWRAHCDGWRGVRLLTWSRGCRRWRDLHAVEQRERESQLETEISYVPSPDYDDVSRYAPEGLTDMLAIVEGSSMTEAIAAWDGWVRVARHRREERARATIGHWEFSDAREAYFAAC